jgi:hypothetical protein
LHRNTLTKHRRPIDIPNGYILNEKKSYISYIIPEDGVNLFYPSSVGWQFIGTSNGVQPSYDDPIFNLNHYRVTPTANQEMYTEMGEELEQGKIYTFSFWAKRLSTENTIEAYIGSYNSLGTPLGFGTPFGVRSFEVDEFWNAYEFQFYTRQVDPAARYFFVFRYPNGGEFYLDGFQLEQKEYRTTYINGELGRITGQDYYGWAGEPYNSPSIRNAHISGGRIMNFADIGFDLISMEGFGLPDFNHNIIELPVNPIGLYQGSTPEQRDITLDFVYYATDIEDMLTARHKLIRQLKSGLLHIYIQLFNCETPITTIYETTLLYDGGAELNLESLYGEKISLDFTTFDPYLYRIGVNSNILIPTKSGNAQLLANANGNWTSIPTVSTITNDWIKALIGPDKNLYLLKNAPGNGGGFLFKYNGTNWTVLLRSGKAGQIFTDMVLAPDNEIFIVGDFDIIVRGINGVVGVNGSNVNFIKFNIFNQLVLPVADGMSMASGNSIIHTIVPMANNKFFIGGKFSQIQPYTDVARKIVTNHMAFYNNNNNRFEVITPTGITDVNGQVFAAMQYEDTLYVGGSFTDSAFSASNLMNINNISSSSANNRSKLPVGNPIGTIYVITKTRYGDIYIGGQFTGPNIVGGAFEADEYINGNLVVSLARVNHNSRTLDGIVGGTVLNFSSATNVAGIIYDMEVDANDKLWIVGNFDYYGDLFLNGFNDPIDNLFVNLKLSTNFTKNTSSIATYDTIQKKWLAPEVIFDDNRIIYDILLANNEQYSSNIGIEVLLATIGGNYKSIRELTLVIDNNAVAVYPAILVLGSFNGESVDLLNITNTTTGKQLYFNKLLAGSEEYLVDLRGILPKVTSNYYGVQNGQLLYGSNAKQFYLVPGTNKLKIGIDLKDLTTSIDPLTVFFIYRNKYLSIDSMVS